MKRFFIALIIVMTALCFTWASAAPEGFEGAAALVPGQTVNVNIAAGEKGEYFSFTPQRDGSFMISSDKNGDTDPYVVLYDAAGEVIDFKDDGSVDVNFSLNMNLESGNTYYILCTDFSIYVSKDEAASSYVVSFDNCPSTPDGFEYYIEYNDAVISGYTGTGGDVNIPSQIEDFTVCTIINMSSDDIKTLTIPSGIFDIEHGAFAKCKNLTSISVSSDNSYFKSVDGVLYSDGDILYAYPAAKEGDYTVPAGAILGYKAFVNTRVSNVTLPDSLEEIDEKRFCDCLSLENVFIPENVYYINADAFHNCPNLTISGLEGSYAEAYAERMNIPFKKTGSITFKDVSIDEEILISDRKTILRVTPNETATYCLNVGISDVDVSVCDSKYIGVNRRDVDNSDKIFYEMKPGVTYYITCVQESEPLATFGFSATKTLRNDAGFEYYVDDSDGDAEILGYHGNAQIIVIPNEINSVAIKGVSSYAFENNGAVKEITVSQGIKSVGEGAFENCSALEKVAFSDTVTFIGGWALKKCVSLKSVSLPSKLGYVNSNLFEKCSKLESVIVPDGATEISWGAFYDCAKLSLVDIPQSVTYISDEAFRNCPSLKIRAAMGSFAHRYAMANNIAFESSKEIDMLELDVAKTVANKEATFGVIPTTTSFYRFDTAGGSVISLNMNDGRFNALDARLYKGSVDSGAVTVYYTSVYYLLEADKTYYVTLKPSSYSEGTYSVKMSFAPKTSDGFYYGDNESDEISILGYMGSESNITVPAVINEKNVARIENRAFYGNNGVTSVVLPDKLRRIGDGAFENCQNLISATIPENVSSIYSRAFFNCPRLTIHGVIGSLAHYHAKLKGIPFEPTNTAIDLTVQTPVTVEHKAETFVLKPGATGVYAFDIKGDYEWTQGMDDDYVWPEVTDESYSDVIVYSNYGTKGNHNIGYFYLERDKTYYLRCRPDKVTDKTYTVEMTALQRTDNGLYYHDAFSDGSIDIIAFEGGDGKITVPARIGNGTVNTIGTRAFKDRPGITDVILPDTLLIINSEAFINCPNLKNILIPSSVEYMHGNVFGYCPNLTIHGEIGSRAQEYATQNSIHFEPTNEAIELELDETASFEHKTNMFMVKPTVSAYYAIDITGENYGEDYVWTNARDDNASSVPGRGNYGFESNRTLSFYYLQADKTYYVTCTPNTVTQGLYDVTLKKLNSTENGIHYLDMGDGTARIVAYTGDESHVTIPYNIGELEANDIGYSAFSNCESVESVEISRGIKNINSYVFMNCSNLAVVSLPDTLFNIGYQAFENCSELSDITIPSSVTYIGDYAFRGCPNLTIHGEIGSRAQEYAAGNDIKFIATNEAIELTVDQTVSAVHKTNAFCVKPTVSAYYAVYVDGENNVWTSAKDENFNNVISDTGGYASVDYRTLSFFPFEAGKTYYLTCAPTAVTEGTYDVTLYKVPSTEDGLHYFDMTGLFSDGVSIIDYDGEGAEVTVPASLGNVSVRRIANGSFTGNSIITSVVLPDTTMQIEPDAFGNCPNLISVTVPASVTYIHERAFNDSPNVSICGEIGSKAHIFAKENRIPFKPSSDPIELKVGEPATTRHISQMFTVTPDDSSYYVFDISGDNNVWPSVIDEDLVSVTMKNGSNIGVRTQSYFRLEADKTYYVACKPDEQTDGTYTLLLSKIHCTDNGLYYHEPFELGFLNIIAYTGNESEVTIPASIAGINVHAVNGGSFLNCSNLQSVIIPYGVERIEHNAFYDCANLTSVSLPETLSVIELRSFMNCASLGEIKIPESVDYIGKEAFMNCANLEKITIPSKSTRILVNAFKGCDNLTIYGLDGSDAHAFARDNSIPFEDITVYEELKLGVSVEIPRKTAYYTVKPTETALYTFKADGINTWTSINGVLIKHGYGIDGEKSRIYAVLEANKTYKVTFPVEGESDGTYTLTWVKTPVTDDGMVYDDMNGRLEILHYSGAGGDITIPEIIGEVYVSAIAQRAFEDDASITGVVIEDKIRIIGNGAFKGLSGLERLTLPQNIASIGSDAFLDCVSLKEIVIPDRDVLIQTQAFKNCSSLESATIPSGVTQIGIDAFIGCDKLTIKGDVGSAAHKFAKDNSIPFKALNYTPNSGDVNLDGETDEKDAQFIIEALAGNGLTTDEINAGDVNNDGAANLKDAVLILRR